MLALNECVKALRISNSTLTTAESCTGGLLGSMLTSQPGSSDWYLGGWITYSNRMKCEMLKIPEDLIDKHGPVSKPVALAMSSNARRISGASFGVSITGLAGPGGGTETLAVGSVWIAVVSESDCLAEFHQYSGTREQVRQQACESALTMLSRIAAA